MTEAGANGPTVLTEGPFAGWSTWSNGDDPFETAIGPFCFKREGEATRCAFEPRREHLNSGGTVHGGVLMGFADFALFAFAHSALRGAPAVTLTFNAEFLSPGRPGAAIEAHGDTLRDTRTLIFIRGLVTQESRPILAFSGTLKKLAAPAA